jgi:hypothetical protein
MMHGCLALAFSAPTNATLRFDVFRLSGPFFELSEPDLNHLTRLGDRICAIVWGTAQFESKFATFSDALHQSVDKITQGSDMLWLMQINVALVPQIDFHGRCRTWRRE